MIEVIKGNAFDSADFLQGHQIGYGLNIPNAFLIMTGFFWIREIIRKKIIIRLSHYKVFLPIFFSALGFITISQYAIVKYSAFKDLSLVWLFQYMQLFTVAFIMLYLFVTQKKYFYLIYPVFFVSLALQFYISIKQFIGQSFVGLPIESGSGSFFQAGLDENNAVFRVAGSFMFHNQLALIILVLTAIIFPVVIEKYSPPKTFILLISLITIALTQSRSVWLALIPICIMAYFYFKKEIARIIVLFSIKRIIIYSIIFLLSLSFVIFPRIILSLNALYQGAGIPLRVQLINEGIEAFLGNPFVGYGPGTNEYVLYTLSPKGVMTEFPAPVHMAFLQLAMETGLLGVSLFVFPFLYLSRIIINLFIQKSIKINQLKEYIFPFISGSIAFLVYYLFLAHVGIIEFAYLGIILGFGMISVFSIRYAKQKNG